MSLDEARAQVFSQPTRQIVMMLGVLVLVALGAVFLARQIETVFLANLYLNAFIGLVFLVGVLATFWQVAQLIAAIRWLKNLQAGFKGHEFTQPPRLVASMAPMLREGKIKKRLAASSTRSILDSIAVRLDEARDITRYITNLLIFLGLLGTFWGLSLTVPAVVETIRSLAPQDGQTSDVNVFDNLMTGLENQLGGMGTAFASSLVGLAGSLVVGLLELFAGHGQNRFYRELEEWLTSFTRLGLVSEGEGPDGALVALLERVDEGLERTTDLAEHAESARVKAEERLGHTADVIAAMAKEIENERQLVSELVSEIRESREIEAGRDHATLTVLKRMEQNSLAAAEGIGGLSDRLHRGGGSGNAELVAGIRELDKNLRLMSDEIAVGRHESTAALRAELRTLINLIDQRTREDGGS
ncbi:biopolymer transporter ExbB [Rhodobacteraceae bacterium NNCM2]|nr:biopolymer transporter ExbB [Coraliihabitans acroporae]